MDSLDLRWLGRVDYRAAWDLQHRLAAARADGRVGDRVLLLEHPPVLTLGRHADVGHVRIGSTELARRGIEVIRVERGGEVTYHGPGQLVAYPIVRLAERELLLRPFVRALEGSMAETCKRLGVEGAGRRDGHPGCWVVDDGGGPARKIGSLGIRVERGVAYHGLALNVSTELADFDLIDPCGLPEVTMTSIAAEVGRTAEPPTTASVERAAGVLGPILAERLGAGSVTIVASDIDRERAGLERSHAA